VLYYSARALISIAGGITMRPKPTNGWIHFRFISLPAANQNKVFARFTVSNRIDLLAAYDHSQ
jgi:hypothetical protein